MSTSTAKAQVAHIALTPDSDRGFRTRIFSCDFDALRELLVLAACPVVCRGYLDGDENWHELCIAKADKAMEALEVHDA